MGHNSVVSGQPKSTGIPRVDRLSMGPPNLGRHTFFSNSCHLLSYLSRHRHLCCNRLDLANLISPSISVKT